MVAEVLEATNKKALYTFAFDTSTSSVTNSSNVDGG
jgi:hypothetical protein